jgi:transketolase
MAGSPTTPRKRFEAYGWNVVRGVDGHDPVEIKTAIETALKSSDKPTLICCRTTIGFGSPNKAGKESSARRAAGQGRTGRCTARAGMAARPFEIPEDIYAGWRAGEPAAREAEWNALFDAYAARIPSEAAELSVALARRAAGRFRRAADAYIAKLQGRPGPSPRARPRRMAIEAFAPLLPELVGGSADLAHSNLTLWKGSKSVASTDPERQLRLLRRARIRHDRDQQRPGPARRLHAVRRHLPGVQRLRAQCGAHERADSGARIHVYTHDSIGLGEDGPTHQPVEHLASLRYIPNNDVWRPCDAVESAVAWKAAIERGRPELPGVQPPEPAAPAAHDAQVQRDRARRLRAGRCRRRRHAGRDPDRHRFGSGLAMQAKARWTRDGMKTRVVSMPSTDVFDRQDAAYRESVLPKAVRKRVAIEAGVTDFWRKYVGLDGAVIGIDTLRPQSVHRRVVVDQ